MTCSADAFVLPSDYRYVVASLLPLVFLLIGQGILVGRFRKAAKIQYPQMYAEKAEASESRDAHLFNCAQRAHQNTLETIPIALITILVSGIRFPKLSAMSSLLFFVSRIFYTRGYITGDVRKRTSNKLYFVATLSVMGLLLVNSFIEARWVLTGN